MALGAVHRERAALVRAQLATQGAVPEPLRTLLIAVPPQERDAWFDLVLGTEDLPEDGPVLPRGCVPYLPCPVATLLRMLEQAGVHGGDVFVDVGSGIGRAAMLTRLLTGAATIGVEIQPHLVSAARDMAARLNVSRFTVLGGDASRLTGPAAAGTVFFLYCPFGGERLEGWLEDLELVARTRPIRVCCVDLPLPGRSWLAPVQPHLGDLAVYRSTFHEPSR